VRLSLDSYPRTLTTPQSFVAAQLIKDKYTGRSKGFAYVELRSIDDVPRALLLNGQRFQFKKGKLGYPILVKPSEAEKNYAWGIEKKNEAASARKIVIENLHKGVSEEAMRSVLAPFGGIADLTIERDVQGQSIGRAVVEFKSASMAARVVDKINGLDLAGKAISVLLMVDATQSSSSAMPATTPPASDTAVSTMASAVADAVTSASVTTATRPLPTMIADGTDVPSAASNWALDSGENVRMDAHTRAAIMRRLAASGNPDPTTPDPTTPVANQPETIATLAPVGPPIGDPSSCMVVKNMFDATEETSATWDEDIREDVVQECARYGEVIHCFVDKASRGYVYLMFDSESAGKSCGFALNGRFFNRKRLSVQFFPRHAYTAKFGL